MRKAVYSLAVPLLSFAASGAVFSSDPAMPMEHEHKMVQMPANVLEPSLDLALARDQKSGFNLQIQTRNFALEPPEQAGGNAPDLLEGHAHIFINGKKIYRAYARYIHLPAELFKPGINQILVSLNDHQHSTWSKGARMVMATLVIDTEKEDFLQHRFVTFQ